MQALDLALTQKGQAHQEQLRQLQESCMERLSAMQLQHADILDDMRAAFARREEELSKATARAQASFEALAADAQRTADVARTQLVEERAAHEATREVLGGRLRALQAASSQHDTRVATLTRELREALELAGTRGKGGKGRSPGTVRELQNATRGLRGSVAAMHASVTETRAMISSLLEETRGALDSLQRAPKPAAMSTTLEACKHALHAHMVRRGLARRHADYFVGLDQSPS